MSDDPSPPDFIDTADFPLDESVLKHVPVPSLEGDPTAPTRAGADPNARSELNPDTRPEVDSGPNLDPGLNLDRGTGSDPNSVSDETTLFAAARPLDLEQNATISGGAGSILEPVIQGPPVLTPRPRATGGFRSLLAAGRHHGQPLYRRQSTVAAGVLCLLTLVVIISFPRSDDDAESALQAGSAVPQPAGATVGSNSKSGVDSVGSEGFFRRSKGEALPGDEDGQAETNVVDAALSEDGEEITPTDEADPSGEQIPAGPSTAPVTTDPPEQTETSVFVGSGLGVTTLPFPSTPETTTAPGAPTPTVATTLPSTATTRRSIPEPTTPTTEPPTTVETSPTTDAPPPTTATPTTEPGPPVTTGPTSTEPGPPSTPGPTTDPTTPTTGPTVTTPTTAPPSSGQNTDPKPTVTTPTPTTDDDDLTEDSATVPTAVSCGPGVTECPPGTSAP